MNFVPALEEIEITLLLEAVYQRFGDDFRGYDKTLLTGKVLHFMRANEIGRVSALLDQVLHDESMGHRLVRALNLRQTTLFGNADLFYMLREVLGPWLRSCAAPRIWIADGTAEEVFGLAILLEEEGLYENTVIFATGASDALLQEAKQGSFAPELLQGYDRNYRLGGGARTLADYCVEHDGKMVFLPQLGRNITWAQYSLASDTSFNEFQMIWCHRPLADFGLPLRQRVLRLFHESLPPFGVLSVAADDQTDISPFATGYKTLPCSLGLYRRIP